MRRLTLAELPAILRGIGAPQHIRAALGDYGPDNNTGSYDELQVYGCLADGSDGSPEAYEQSGTSLGMIQQSPGDAPGFDDIVWSSQYYIGQAGQSDIQIAADRKRVVLIVEKVDSTTVPVGVNFGTQAQIFGAAPAGLQLYNQGSVLYVDRYCPTNDIHLNLLGATSSVISQCVVVIGTRGAMKIPLPVQTLNEMPLPEAPPITQNPQTGQPIQAVMHPVTGQWVNPITAQPVAVPAPRRRFFSNFSAGG